MPRSILQNLARAARIAPVLLGLCASTGCVHTPTMKLDHAEITGLRVTFPPSASILMTVVIQVYNPNSYDVAVRAVRGQVMMAERYPLPVDFRADGSGIWLPADQTSTVRVPVSVPVELAVTLLKEAFQAPVIPYRFAGKADVTATRTFQLEKDDYSVNERGVVSRAQIEQAVRSIF